MKGKAGKKSLIPSYFVLDIEIIKRGKRVLNNMINLVFPWDLKSLLAIPIKKRIRKNRGIVIKVNKKGYSHGAL